MCTPCVAVSGESRAKEVTEIQNLQIGDGDVTRGVYIPIYMLFPRMFTCPTTLLPTTSVEFEVNVIINFVDHYSVTENCEFFFPYT